MSQAVPKEEGHCFALGLKGPKSEHQHHGLPSLQALQAGHVGKGPISRASSMPQCHSSSLCLGATWPYLCLTPRGPSSAFAHGTLVASALSLWPARWNATSPNRFRFRLAGRLQVSRSSGDVAAHGSTTRSPGMGTYSNSNKGRLMPMSVFQNTPDHPEARSTTQSCFNFQWTAPVREARIAEFRTAPALKPNQRRKACGGRHVSKAL